MSSLPISLFSEPQTFVSWFGENVPHRHSAFYREEYRPFYIQNKAGRFIEGFSEEWKNASKEYEIPVGALVKFGPFFYRCIDRKEQKYDCSQCDIGYHCSCDGINCGFHRKDGKTVGYQRIALNPEKMPGIAVDIPNGDVCRILIRWSYNDYKFWPKDKATISFDIAFYDLKEGCSSPSSTPVLNYVSPEWCRDNLGKVTYVIPCLWDEASGKFFVFNPKSHEPSRLDSIKLKDVDISKALSHSFSFQLKNECKGDFTNRSGVPSLNNIPNEQHEHLES